MIESLPHLKYLTILR